MPTFIVNWLVAEALKLITPEATKKLEDMAKNFVVCELKKFASTTPTSIDDTLVAAVAAALGVSCP